MALWGVNVDSWVFGRDSGGRETSASCIWTRETRGENAPVCERNSCSLHLSLGKEPEVVFQWGTLGCVWEGRQQGRNILSLLSCVVSIMSLQRVCVCVCVCVCGSKQRLLLPLDLCICRLVYVKLINLSLRYALFYRHMMKVPFQFKISSEGNTAEEECGKKSCNHTLQ